MRAMWSCVAKLNGTMAAASLKTYRKKRNFRRTPEPKGEYVAVTVMIWDTGTYRNVTKKNDKEVPITRALKNGHVAVQLAGKKIDGRYALSRIAKGKKPRWLLVKMKDEKADARRNPVKTETKSAVTGRTTKQIAKKEKG